jgi:DNA-binding transcriptional MerR regulator
MSSYRISQLAEQTGFSPSTLRYYEQVGLLTTERTSGGYRSYGDAEVQRLRLISRAKQLGLRLDSIRELLAVWDGGPCTSVKARLDELLTARSTDVAARISELTTFGADLVRARDGLAAPSPAGPCDDGCGCAAAAQVPIACTLSGDGQAARRAEWADLLGRATGRTDTDGGADITFRADPDLAGRLAALAAREKQCCSFFAFTLDLTAAESVTLRIRAPREAGSLVAGLLAAT